MKITVLCTATEHPVWQALLEWTKLMSSEGNSSVLVSHVDDAIGGDFLFLVSCSTIVSAKVRSRYRFNLVLHASDLPTGRGWSPYIHEVLAGADHLTMTLLEAEDALDSGAIWLKTKIPLQGHELLADILEKIIQAEIALMNRAVTEYATIQPMKQSSSAASYYPRRTPADSELDAGKTIADQMNLLRVVDNQRFPAYFRLNGRRYRLQIEDEGPDEK